MLCESGPQNILLLLLGVDIGHNKTHKFNEAWPEVILGPVYIEGG